MNYWFEYSSTGAIVNRYLQDTAPTPASGNSLVSFDYNTATPDVVTAYNFPNRYLIQGSPAKPVAQPYITLSTSSGTGTTGTGSNVYNVTTHTVTATIQNPPASAPTSVAFSLFGASFTAPVTNGQATLTIATHPAVNDPMVNVTVSATGCMDGTTSFGSTVPTYALKAEIPSGDTHPIIHPSGTGARSALSTYWTSTATNSAYTTADLATIVGLLIEPVFDKILPQMETAGTVTLSANQKNLIDFMRSTILPTLPSTMEVAAPVPASGQAQSFDSHFGHYQSVQQATKTAMEQYGYDVSRFSDVL